jgi:hypothetical protein
MTLHARSNAEQDTECSFADLRLMIATSRTNTSCVLMYRDHVVITSVLVVVLVVQSCHIGNNMHVSGWLCTA